MRICEVLSIKNHPSDSVKYATIRSAKIPNSKVIKLGPSRGFIVVDRNDPRPEVVPNYQLLSQLAELRLQIKKLRREINRIEYEYSYPFTHDVAIYQQRQRDMFQNTAYNELRKEKAQLQKELYHLEKLPTHIVISD